MQYITLLPTKFLIRCLHNINFQELFLGLDTIVIITREISILRFPSENSNELILQSS